MKLNTPLLGSFCQKPFALLFTCGSQFDGYSDPFWCAHLGDAGLEDLTSDPNDGIAPQLIRRCREVHPVIGHRVGKLAVHG